MKKVLQWHIQKGTVKSKPARSNVLWMIGMIPALTMNNTLELTRFVANPEYASLP